MGICVGFCFCDNSPHNCKQAIFICLCIGASVGQCENRNGQFRMGNELILTKKQKYSRPYPEIIHKAGLDIPGFHTVAEVFVGGHFLIMNFTHFEEIKEIISNSWLLIIHFF